MKYFYISLLILSLNVIQASVKSNSKDNGLSILVGKGDDKEDSKISKAAGLMRRLHHKQRKDAKDRKSAKSKMNIVKNVRKHEDNLNIGRDMPSSRLTESIDNRIGGEYFHMDPVLNELRHRRFENLRRRGSGYQSSSEMEMKYWMDEWDEHWMQKKFEALNSTQPRGDVVNMVAARPWGVPCGDPNQHDMPWGSCMLPMECDSEYRIYRGDYFCGRTSFVCCSLQVTNYDMYQGLDISFEGSSFSTDSNEKNAKHGSKEEERKKREAERNKRKRDRDKRKRRIKKSIRRIITEIRKILNRAYRNGTSQRKRKTKELKKFIEMMKKQYRKDRKSVVNVHEFEMVKIDETLQAKLDKIKGMNEAFMTNDTYREIIVNGTVNKKKLAALLRNHPGLATLFRSRRSGDNNLEPLQVKALMEVPLPEMVVSKLEIDAAKPETKIPIHDYDIEVGVLYY